jgi:uncharacterized protein (DUF608 family)
MGLESEQGAGQVARWLSPDATEVAFPLGGIGTGTISLGARGDLRDFEIWNEPRKGLVLPFAHFTLWTQAEGGNGVTRVLEGRIPPPYTASHGIHPNHAGGLPRFAESRFRGQYPVAELELRDPDVPVQVDLLAYTPLVPIDPDDSGLPCIVFRWRITNPGAVPVRATVVASLINPVGYAGIDVRQPAEQPERRSTQLQARGRPGAWRILRGATHPFDRPLVRQCRSRHHRAARIDEAGLAAGWMVRRIP